jgi:hypothetical protein
MKLQKQIDELLARIERLEKNAQATSAPERSVQAALSVPDALALEALCQTLIRDVSERWARLHEPVTFRVLSQTYARQFRPHGGVRSVVASLERAGRLGVVYAYTGAMLLLPREVLSELSADALEALRAAGLSASALRKYKERNAALVLDAVRGDA